MTHLSDLDYPPAHVTVDWLAGSAYAITCLICHAKAQTSSPTNAAAIVREHIKCGFEVTA